LAGTGVIRNINHPQKAMRKSAKNTSITESQNGSGWKRPLRII